MTFRFKVRNSLTAEDFVPEFYLKDDNNTLALCYTTREPGELERVLLYIDEDGALQLCGYAADAGVQTAARRSDAPIKVR